MKRRVHHCPSPPPVLVLLVAPASSLREVFLVVGPLEEGEGGKPSEPQRKRKEKKYEPLRYEGGPGPE